MGKIWLRYVFFKKLHECHAVTMRTMNTTWWPWDSHGEIKRFPLGECPIWPAPHHKRFLVVSTWRFCYHEESRGLTMRFFWSPREIFWWIKIFTCPHTKSFLMVSPWDSLCHHEESRSLTVRFFWSPRGIFWWMKIFTYPTTTSFLVVSPLDSFGHHKQSFVK